MQKLDTIGQAAELFNAGRVFAAFDLETTGLSAAKDRIVEIAAVKFDRRGVISRFAALVNPGVPMPEGAGDVNHITDEMLAGKSPPEAVLPDFLRFIDGAALVAHNAPFDCGFVNESLKRLFEGAARERYDARQADIFASFSDGEDGGGEGGASAPRWIPPFPELPNPVADTVALAKEAFPGMRRYNLQELSAALGVLSKDAHRAEDDARVCMEIFLRCVAGA
jgi:DNA polymerase-3 subunit epsilon